MSTQTTNFSLTKDTGTDYYNIDTTNDNLDKIDKALGNTAKFETAGGSATAINLTYEGLSKGLSKSFIIAANNNGAATTINGKSLYKPGTTIAPKLIAGKAVTVWYDETSDCFFIKASAEGTAVVGNVLADKTFSNDDDTGLVGTMTNNGAVTITPGTTDHAIPAGYHNGTGKVTGDADLISANIKSGANIYGVAGNSNVIDTSPADASAGEVLVGKKVGVDGAIITGTMPNRGAVTITPGTTDQTIPSGYHNGTGKVTGDADLISANIKAGANIFGVAGNSNVIDTSTGDAVTGEILAGKKAAVDGSVLTGTMTNNAGSTTAAPTAAVTGQATGIIDVTVPANGYYSTTSKLRITDADAIAANIAKDKNVFGIVGTLDGRIYNFPLSIQDAQPTAVRSGHIWVKSSILAASITTVKVLEALNAGEANGTLMLVVGDLVYRNESVSHTKERTDGGSIAFSIADNTGVTAGSGSWLVSQNSGGMTNTLYMNKPFVYSKVGDALDIETSYMWNGSAWVLLCEKGSYIALGMTSNSLRLFNWNNSAITAHSTITSGVANDVKFNADGRFTYSESSRIVYKRTGDIFSSYFTAPSTYLYTANNLNYQSSMLTMSADGTTVVLGLWVSSGGYTRYLILIYKDNGATFALSQELSMYDYNGSGTTQCPVFINSDATLIIVGVNGYKSLKPVFKGASTYSASSSWLTSPTISSTVAEWYSVPFISIFGTTVTLIGGYTNSYGTEYGYCEATINFTTQVVGGATRKVPAINQWGQDLYYANNRVTSSGMIYFSNSYTGVPMIRAYDPSTDIVYTCTIPSATSSTVVRGVGINATGNRMIIVSKATSGSYYYIYLYSVVRDDTAQKLTLTQVTSFNLSTSTDPYGAHICPN